MKTWLCLLLFGFSFPVIAQIYPQIGARSNGLANASLSINDVWSTYNNPGAFGALEQTSVGVSYENRFLLKELSYQTFAFGLHTAKHGNFGLHFQQFGFQLYRYVNGGLTYGMKMSENFSAGVSINYHGIYLAENYGSRNTLTAGFGLLYSVNSSLKLAMRATNLSRVRLADYTDERLPTQFSLGLLYQISKKAFWSVDVEKDIVHKLTVKSGIEIQAHDVFAVRLGINTRPFQSAFGFSISLKKFQFDFASMWHSSLGLSPSGGLTYKFN